jgi:radical SAM superfamily enzyme YgiQ (UPF0313 family)
MKIALVAYNEFENAAGYYPPVHLCSLGTALEIAGYEVKIFDYSGPFSRIGDFFRTVQDYRPGIVGLTCYTPYLASFFKYTKLLREYVPLATMIVGGAHASVWPEWTLVKMPHFDYAMRGEADRSIVSFAQMIDGKTDEQHVPGLVYRRGKEILANDRDKIDNLNELPQINRALLDECYRRGIYWNLSAHGKMDMMITSRGCPYDCSFCFKVERKYRFRSVDHLMPEFEALRKRGVRNCSKIDFLG